MTDKTDLRPKGEAVGMYQMWSYDQMQSYDFLHHTVMLQAEIERLRAEVKRLQEIVRPKREDECLTLDHWRMWAYALEENWSRCSRACAIEQDKREQAEARAKQLEEALRELEEREKRDEAGLQQVLKILDSVHQIAMEQTIKARDPECRKFWGIAQYLGFAIATLRERLSKEKR